MCEFGLFDYEGIFITRLTFSHTVAPALFVPHWFIFLKVILDQLKSEKELRTQNKAKTHEHLAIWATTGTVSRLYAQLKQEIEPTEND